ncbi:hypothetical protein OROHE_015999 [Orobanche hederae]
MASSSRITVEEELDIYNLPWLIFSINNERAGDSHCVPRKGKPSLSIDRHSLLVETSNKVGVNGMLLLSFRLIFSINNERAGDSHCVPRKGKPSLSIDRHSLLVETSNKVGVNGMLLLSFRWITQRRHHRMSICNDYTKIKNAIIPMNMSMSSNVVQHCMHIPELLVAIQVHIIILSHIRIVKIIKIRWNFTGNIIGAKYSKS